MSKLDELKEEMNNLRSAQDGLYQAIDAFQTISWTDNIGEPHHVMMEMEEVLTQVTDRIEEIEDKVERI